MSLRFGVLINPTAGHGRGRKCGLETLSELQRLGYTAHDLSGSSSVESFNRAVDARDDYDALIVVGGDGMAHVGFNLTAGTSTPLGLIAVGSGNDLARHLRLPLHKVAKGVETIVAALEHGATRVDALRLTPATNQKWPQDLIPTPHRWAGCVVSAGFDSMVNARANTYTWPRGMARYVRGVLHELRRFSPYPYAVTIDGAYKEFPGTLIAVANAPSFGGGMKIAPSARANSGEIAVVTAGEVTRGQLLSVFPKVYRGTHLSHPAVTTASAKKITIGASAGGQIPNIFADGELVGEAPVEIELVAGAVHMLCPSLDL